MVRSGSCALLALTLSSVTFADEKDESAKEQKATQSIQSIQLACEAYLASPSNVKGTYPQFLGDLVRPPFGGAAFLRNGDKDLTDPWNNPFQYKVAKDEKGNLQAYIWSERTAGKQTKVVGTKPPEPKKAQPDPKKPDPKEVTPPKK